MSEDAYSRKMAITAEVEKDAYRGVLNGEYELIERNDGWFVVVIQNPTATLDLLTFSFPNYKTLVEFFETEYENKKKGNGIVWDRPRRK